MAWSELRDVVSSLTFQSQRCDPFLSEHESLQMGLGFSVLRGYPVFSQHCLTEALRQVTYLLVGRVLNAISWSSLCPLVRTVGTFALRKGNEIWDRRF